MNNKEDGASRVKRHRFFTAFGQSGASVLPAFGTMIGILALSTAASMALRALGFSEANYILTYVLGVLFIAYLTHGYVYGVLASILSVLIFNFFFTKPYYSFNVYNPNYLVTFSIMLIAALITSTLTTRIRFESKQAEMREKRIQILYQIERHLVAAQNLQQVVEAASDDIHALFGSSVIIMGEEGRFNRMTRCEEGRDVFCDERESIAWNEAIQSGCACGAGTELFPDCNAYYQPILGQNGVLGVVGIVRKGGETVAEDQRILLEAILAQVSLAVEREQSNEKQRQAQITMERERLQSDLLRSISHDLRTPLTGILGSASTAIEGYQTLPAATILSLLQDIYEDADWLKSLVENVLSMTRLGEGKIALKRDAQVVEELIASALDRVKSRMHDRKIMISIPDEMLIVYVDGLLIEQAIFNILDNATKYTPDGTTITISAFPRGEFVQFEIGNDGPGIPDEQLERIFNRFYTQPGVRGRRGSGLGLSICKTIVEAHGGDITAQNSASGGLKFVFTLPAKEIGNGTDDSDRGR